MRSVHSLDDNAPERRNSSNRLEDDELIPLSEEHRMTENEETTRGPRRSSQRITERRNSAASSHGGRRKSDSLQREISSDSILIPGLPGAARGTGGGGGSSKATFRRYPTGIEPGNYADELALSFGVKNPQSIEWSHAVNSKSKLNEALNSPDVQMIEVDVMFGTYDPTSSGNAVASCTSRNNSQDRHKIILCHPPYTTSDLSLRRFLELVCAHNERVERRRYQNQGTSGPFAAARGHGAAALRPQSSFHTQQEATATAGVRGKTAAERGATTGLTRIITTTIAEHAPADDARDGESQSTTSSARSGKSVPVVVESRRPSTGEAEALNASGGAGSFLTSCGYPQLGPPTHDDERGEGLREAYGGSRAVTGGSLYEIVVDPERERKRNSGRRMRSGLGLEGILKGIKLDFKDEACIDGAIELLEEFRATQKIPSIWLNADVCFGPGVIGQTLQVVPGAKFLAQCSRVPDAVVSLGWKVTEYSVFYSKYSKDMIDDMLSKFQNNNGESPPNDGTVTHGVVGGGDNGTPTPSNVANTDEPGKSGTHGGAVAAWARRETRGGSPTNKHVTFAVNAYYLINSLPNLSILIDSVTAAGWSASLTIWTGMGSFGVTPEAKADMLRQTREAGISAFIDVKLKKPGRSCGNECSVM